MIRIRYNTNYPLKSDKKWRLLINGEQILVDEINIFVPCHTTTDIVLGDDGKDVQKYHISCEGKVEYTTDSYDNLIANIN